MILPILLFCLFIIIGCDYTVQWDCYSCYSYYKCLTFNGGRFDNDVFLTSSSCTASSTTVEFQCGKGGCSGCQMVYKDSRGYT